MRPRFHSEPGPDREGQSRPVELVRVRRAQRDTGDEGYRVKGRARRRGGRGRRRGRREASEPVVQKQSFLGWLKSLFGFGKKPRAERPKRQSASSLDQQESRVLADFQQHFGTTFNDPVLLKLALTHRSYLSVTGQGPRESNERLEFLGDSVLGLVTSEFLYRRAPDEHEGQLTKTKSLLVSKAILSRRALRMGLGRFVLMSHSEVESGGRQRLSILADAFESVLGAVYLDQGFEVARQFIHTHLLEDSDSIVADKRHTNYKSHLQEYVQSTYRTHPVYRIRSEYGPDHSKHFMVEVMVGRRTLGEGRGHNKKEAEQAAARDALERVERLRTGGRDEADTAPKETAAPARVSEAQEVEEGGEGRRRRGRRGGRGRTRGAGPGGAGTPGVAASETDAPAVRWEAEDDSLEELDEEPVRSPAGSMAEVRVAAPVAGAEDQDDEDEDDDAEPFDDDEYEEEEVDDLDEDGEDDDEDDEEDDEDDDDEEADEDDEDEEDDARPASPDRVSGVRPATIPATEAPARASRATPTAAVPAVSAPVSYGRSGRRSGARPAASPSPAPTTAEAVTTPAPVPAPAAAFEEAEPSAPSTPHEELHVDPYAVEEEQHIAPVVEVIPPAEDDEDPDARIEEMERAMANFGQRRGPEPPAPRRTPYGRKGRRR